MTIVYLLEVGCYDDRHVAGVFGTSEAARAAHHPKPGATKGHEFGPEAGESWSYLWEQDEDGDWTFGADWGDAATIRAIEVQ